MKIKGKCHLCDEPGELEESHVWPAFAYKHFATDQAKGGQFVQLGGEGKLDNHQITYHWFCRRCEERLGRSENYAAGLCRTLCSHPGVPVEYDERLFLFAVSISWRSAKAHSERNRKIVLPKVSAALRKWKLVLRGDKHRVEPFSQHVFAVYHPTSERHHMLGGNIFPDQNLVFSQIGPLHIIGLLGHEDITKDTLRLRRLSKLENDGGTLHPVTEWRYHPSDRGVNQIIPFKWLRFLGGFEQHLIERVKEIVPKLGLSGAGRGSRRRSR
jgi:hypothetical protein